MNIFGTSAIQRSFRTAIAPLRFGIALTRLRLPGSSSYCATKAVGAPHGFLLPDSPSDNNNVTGTMLWGPVIHGLSAG